MKPEVSLKREEKPSLFKYFMYVLPCSGTAFVFTPITILQGVYAKYYGLSLTTIAIIILLGRIFDSVSDPLIGYFSDRYYARNGTRKPFMVAGGVLLSAGSYFLYSPPQEITALYFSVWLIVFYLGWTLFEIPHMTWGGELAKYSKEKAKIYSMRTAAGYIGLTIFYAIPLLPFLSDNSITPDSLRLSGLIGPVLILSTLFLCLKVVPNNGVEKFHIPMRKTTPNIKNDLLLLFSSLMRNKPFLILLLAVLPIGVGASMWYGLIFIYVDIYLGVGELFAGMFLFAFVIAIASTPVWYKLAATFGSKPVYGLSVALMVVSYIYTAVLQPDDISFSKLIVLKVLNTVGGIGSGVAVLPLLSDAADYGTWKFRENRSASYFSIYLLLSKITGAIGGALGLAIVGWYGFDPASTVQTGRAIFGLTIAAAWFPACLFVISFIFILMIPMNSRRHEIVRSRLENSKKINSVSLSVNAELA